MAEEQGKEPAPLPSSRRGATPERTRCYLQFCLLLRTYCLAQSQRQNRPILSSVCSLPPAAGADRLVLQTSKERSRRHCRAAGEELLRSGLVAFYSLSTTQDGVVA